MYDYDEMLDRVAQFPVTLLRRADGTCVVAIDKDDLERKSDALFAYGRTCVEIAA